MNRSHKIFLIFGLLVTRVNIFETCNTIHLSQCYNNCSRVDKFSPFHPTSNTGLAENGVQLMKSAIKTAWFEEITSAVKLIVTSN